MPEDPASLLIDRLAGKWAIKNFSQDRARSAATCRGRPALELDERGIFQNSRKAQISLRIEAVKLDYTFRFVRVNHYAGASLLRATQQARLPRCITESIDEKLREKLLGNELDYFFHNLWFEDTDKLLQLC